MDGVGVGSEMRTGGSGIATGLGKPKRRGEWRWCFERGGEATGRELVEGRSLIDRGLSGKKCVVLGKKRLSGPCPCDAPLLWYCCGSTLSFSRDLRPNGQGWLFDKRKVPTKEPDLFSLPPSSTPQFPQPNHHKLQNSLNPQRLAITSLQTTNHAARQAATQETPVTSD